MVTLRMRYGNRALFQKLIKRMRRVDEPWERQTAPRIYIHTELVKHSVWYHAALVPFGPVTSRNDHPKR